MKSHEEFVEEVINKTRPLTVPEESEEALSEGYEWNPEVKGPRSRPEYERRKTKDASCEGGGK